MSIKIKDKVEEKRPWFFDLYIESRRLNIRLEVDLIALLWAALIVTIITVITLL